MINNKLIIGTANFGQQYGIGKSKVDSKKLYKILKYAETKNLNHFDTAIAYNNNQNLFKRFNSISKINLKITPNKKWRSSITVRIYFKLSKLIKI